MGEAPALVHGAARFAGAPALGPDPAHLGGDADGDLRRGLGADGHADGGVDAFDLFLGEARVQQPPVHAGHLGPGADDPQIGVGRGQTPYHPGKMRRPHGKPHPARTLPNRRRISERPQEAGQHSEPGFIELDTIVSGANGSGGLLTAIDDHTRRVAIEKLAAIRQDEVSGGLRRAIERGAIDRDLKSATTDNGTELSHQEELEAILGCLVYYTRAYASYEKGAVENANRIIRRWFPKGTDFSKVPEEEILAVEKIVNSIHRKSLGGLSADAYHKKLKNAA